MFTKLQVSRNFHVKSMSWSTRKRGKVQRIHRKTNIISIALPSIHIQLGIKVNGTALIGEAPPPRKNVASRNEPSSTYAYSARKKMDHLMPEYSVWKPLTSSDSASG